jgi:arsenate reductase-like glutaredoxin family protein
MAILMETPGVDVTVVEYLKTPPGAAKLAQLYRDAGMTPQGLRLQRRTRWNEACPMPRTPPFWPRWRPNPS